MKGAVSALELVRPATLDDALALLRDEAPLTPLAGCTDLYVLLNAGTLPGRRFLDLQKLGELRAIEPAGDVLRIGALASYTAIITSPDVQAWLPMLVAAAREIGGAQIQNRGTLGGNLANGSPAGDTLPVLSAAEATIVLRSASTERRVAMADFYTGYRRSVLGRDELIVALEIPRIDGAQWFRKVGTRAAQAISKIVMAGVRAPRPRIALGSVAATVVRVPRTEAALADGAGIDAATEVLLTEITPIDDIRSTGTYRSRVAANLLRRFWLDTQP